MSDTIDAKSKSFPRLSKSEYFTWLSHVQSIYEGFCQDLYPHGLLDLLLDDAAWLALNGIADRPLRTNPPEPADNAAAPIVAYFNRRCVNNGRSLGLKADLKILLFESIGEVNVLCLRDPITHTRNLTELQIMEAMHVKYSQPSTDTLAMWRSMLATNITDSMDIDEFLAHQKHVHDNFAAVLQPISEADKIVAAVKALLPRTAAGMAITKYKMDAPNVALQTFDNFSKFLILQVPNMDVSTSSMNYASHTSAADFDTRVAEAVTKALAPFAALMQSQVAPVRTARRSTHYCYLHGYCFHPGSTCTVMKAAPKEYTKAMCAAKDHLSGGSSKNI